MGSTRRRRVAVLLAALALMASSAPALAQQSTEQSTRQPTAAAGAGLSLEQRAQASRTRGSAKAPVLVYEIADFQCPYCARFAQEVFPSIDSAYIRTGKVKWVFLTLPLPGHRYGWASAEAALCAGGVADRFWPFERLLYEKQQTWAESKDPTPYFRSYARSVGVPLAPYEDCVAHDSVASLIIEDVIAAASSRITGTPTFVVDNAEMVLGVKSFRQWQTLLDQELEKRRKHKGGNGSR